MAYSPSYQALSTDHKAFVNAYIRTGCDQVAACQFLHPADSHEQNVQRAWRLMNRDDIQAAITDKLQQQEEKFAITRDQIAKKILDLLERSSRIDNADQKVSVFKFQLECLDKLARIHGYHQVQHNHVHQRDIQITFERVNKHGEPIAIAPAEVIPELPAPDPYLPPADPVRYTMDDLDDISEPQDDQP